MQQLYNNDGSGAVTIPKQSLADDGLLTDEGEIPDSQPVDVARLGRRVYVVRFPDGDSLPELAETDVIRRIAAQVQFVPRSDVDPDIEHAD
jgi:hypothetical protein